MGGWVTATYRHCTPKSTFKGGFKAVSVLGFREWSDHCGRHQSWLQSWWMGVSHVCWFVTEERTWLHLSLGFSLRCPQIIKAEARRACCALFLLGEGGLVGCLADIWKQ